MRLLITVTRLLLIFFVIASAAAAQEMAEQTVLISRPQPEGMTFRIVNGQFQIDFERQWHASEARLGQKSLAILASEEPGSFSNLKINKGLLIKSYRAGGSRQSLFENAGPRKTYRDRVFIEIEWAGSVTPDPKDQSAVVRVESEGLMDALAKAGFKKEDLPTNPITLQSTFTNSLDVRMAEQALRELAAAGYLSQEEVKKLKWMTSARKQGHEPRQKIDNELYNWGKMLGGTYLEHVQKAALVKEMGLHYDLEPHRIGLENLERLASVVLWLPAIKEGCLDRPGPGADDHGTKALNSLSTKAVNIFNYLTGKPGAAEALGPADQRKADAAFMLSVQGTFTPDESAEKVRASSPARPFRAGLVGEVLKEIELNGRTDPAAGSIIHWWTVETAHPRNFAINVADDQYKTHIIQWFPKGPGSLQWLVRVRGIGPTVADYSLKCSDTILSKGESVRAFANGRPLEGEFPY